MSGHWVRVGSVLAGAFLLLNCRSAPLSHGISGGSGGLFGGSGGDEPGPGCHSITVEVPAEWECSEAQLAYANSYPTFGEQASAASYAGATAPPGTPTGQVAATDVALAVTDCDGLANLRRPALKAGQRATLDRQRWSTLRSKCFGQSNVRYEDDAGRDVGYCSRGSSGAGGTSLGGSSSGGAYPSGGNSSSGTAGSAGASPTPPIDPEGDGAGEYSGTNVQVAGVDEPDFVKNDSGYVYALSSDGLHVIDAWPAPGTHEIAHVMLTGEPRRLFLMDDRLVVYSRLASPSELELGSAGYPPSVPSSQGCTYGYDCRFTSEGGLTLATVFDVSDPANPRELRRFAHSGGFVAARRVGPTVYTVVHDFGPSAAPGVDLDLHADSLDAFEAEYQRLLTSADEAVDELPSQYFLPWVRESDATGGAWSEVSSCDQALVTRAASGQSFVSVVAFDLATLSGLSRSIAATKPGFVYASNEALYLATDGVDGSDSIYGFPAEDDWSTIHKFSLAGASTRYAGSQPVRGHVLNQFSMDEYGGVLRVATSSGHVPEPGVSSSITTLRESSGELVKLGELQGLAPEEDIRSVRFDGDRGFVVTFKKTDPLFVIDLATAEQPSVLGELHIPGFSTYLQRLDANHLLAVGFDADDQGDYAFFDGIQIQIFDVTDLRNPTLLHKLVIGTRGSGSEALMNHLAFNYFAPRGLLALPMTICEGGDNGVYGDTLTFAGLMVFDVSLAGGITEHGRLPFLDPERARQTPGATCGTWWADSTSLVKRSIFMDDYAYGLSDSVLKVAELGNLETVLTSVPLIAAP